MLWKCCTQYASKFGKLSSGHRTQDSGKGQFSFQSQEKKWQRTFRLHTIALISHASKVILKILQERLQQYVNWELANVQAGFRKGRGTRYQIANIHWITEKAREFQENSYFCFIDYTKIFDCVDHNKLWKILMQVKKQQLELDMEQQTGSKSGKEHLKAVYCHSAYLTYMQST